MEYIISQMILYLVAAAAIGFSTAWYIRGRIGKQQPESIYSRFDGQRSENKRLNKNTRFEN